ncbi:scramblase, partial [Candidatus Poribacteria bacterium]|nr:scramblase [Candidatus Poribacteria bacterium]
ARVDSLAIQQVKEWGEILTGFETRNKYRVMDASGADLLYVGEEGGSLLGRLFLKALRPFTLRVFTGEDTALVLRRPFRFFFHHLDVLDDANRPLGSITREFSILRRVYTVRDPSGQEMFTLFGPLLRPWTFQIMRDGREAGVIHKKWSGFMKEAFSDADNFGVTFPDDADEAAKAVLLGAVFLIDFVHFENKGDN